MNQEHNNTTEQPINFDYLAGALAKDENLQNLTVVRMALKDLEAGDSSSVISRLKVDLDKIRAMNPDLY